MRFLARILDRLTWPVLIAAGAVLLAMAGALSMSVVKIDAPMQQMARIADVAKPQSEPVPSEAVPQAVPGKPPSAEAPHSLPPPSPAGVPEHPAMVTQLSQDLQQRIRMRVHDELARVQIELEKAQQAAMHEHEDKRRDAEQTIREAQREFAAKKREFDETIRDAGVEYAARQREIQNEFKDAEQEAGGSKHAHANNAREMDKAQRNALKEFEDTRRDATRELQDAQAEMQRAIADAQKEIARRVAILSDSNTYKVLDANIPNFEIKIPEIRIPELDSQVAGDAPPAKAAAAASATAPRTRSPAAASRAAAAPAVSSAPATNGVPAVPVAPTAPIAPVATAAPLAPLSKETMALVEQNVGTAVANTVGEEVHSAVKGYRLAVTGMLFGIALLLFAGAVVGKTVLTSNRAARARADLLRVEAERNVMSRQLVESHLKMIQAQVEPHFLFNTLANVRFLQESDPAGASTMLDHLIDYLHAALPQMREHSATLVKETELARAYLEILRIRMGSRLEFAIHVPGALQGVSFPPMMLLSLVENAIKHGLEPMREGGRVDVEAALVVGRLRLAVKDTGAGLGAAAAADTGSGVGLTNIRERLRTLYGEDARLILADNQPRGTVAAIEIPYAQIDHCTAG